MKTKGSFKNFKLGSVLSSWANKTMTLHPIKREWRVAIVTMLTAKLLTMIISMFAGYSFFYAYILPVAKNVFWTVIFSVVLLAGLEVLTAVFLEKTFKFFYRHRFLTAVASFIIVSGFYSVSFISSTNGLANRQADKKDLTAEIIKTEASEIKKAENKTALLTADLNLQISDIKKNPQGWSNGKRAYLTAKQLDNIAILNNKKEELQTKHLKAVSLINNKTANKFSENKKVTRKTAKQYYKFMSIVMISQFFITGILIYFLYLIRSQESKDSVVSEDLKEITDTVENNAMTLIFNSIIGTSNKLTDHVGSQILAGQYPDIQNCKVPAISGTKQDKKLSEKPETKTEKTPLIVTGFGTAKTENKTSQENRTKNTEQLRYLNNADKSNLSYLHRHKHLVTAIKKLNPEPEKSISNNEILIVKQTAKKAQYKSRSTIQKVFTVMQTITSEELEKIIK